MGRRLKKIGVIGVGIILFHLLALAGPAFSRPGGLEVDMGAGVRHDQVDWSIAGELDGTSPNVLSELTWSDLKIFQINSNGRLVLKKDQGRLGVLVRGTVNYGMINSGDNQDSDYASDDRQDEFSRSNNNASGGDVWDLSLGGGIVFFLANQRFSIAPVAGASYHQQNLEMTDGLQTVPAYGPFPGLDSSYDAEWKGGWVGVDLEFVAVPETSIYATMELHGGEYNAKANWNLRDDFQHPVSYRHKADDAYGVKLNFGVKDGTERVKVKLDLFYQKWRADDGIDTTYFSNGLVLQTKLNEVNWESYGLNVGVLVKF